MPVLDVLLYPDPRLKQPSPPVEAVDATVQGVVDDLIETMHAHPGVGVAAPQVGVMQRIVVIDVTGKAPGQGLIVMINPVITRMEEEKTVREGCLSIPEYTANVTRAQKVWFTAQDRDGVSRELYSEGLEAVAVQHEMDHLDGILFLDRVRSLKKDLFRRKAYVPPPDRPTFVVDEQAGKLIPQTQ
ncbi:MAG TPA: peptide deformylase [Candidatus Xenobia bacterium]|jgi:peptide deformylase